MNPVKIAYILCNTVTEIFLVCLAVAAPIWLTPGLYYWTAFGIIMMLCFSVGFTGRLNSWGDFGNTND